MIIKIEKNKQKIFEHYYKIGFKEENKTHSPQDVFLQINKNNKVEGMYTGMPFDKSTWYSQHTCRIRNTMAGDECHKEFMRYLLDIDYDNYICYVPNDNIPCIMRMLKSGFHIIGVKKFIGKDLLLIEFYKNMKEDYYNGKTII